MDSLLTKFIDFGRNIQSTNAVSGNSGISTLDSLGFGTQASQKMGAITGKMVCQRHVGVTRYHPYPMVKPQTQECKESCDATQRTRAFVEKQLQKSNPFMNMPNSMNVNFDKMKKKPVIFDLCSKQTRYSKEQMDVSERYGILDHGYIIPESVVKYIVKCEKRATGPTERDSKLIFDSKMAEAVGRAEAVLFDRLKGGVKKHGERLAVGAMTQAVLDEHFGKKWKGKREVIVRRKAGTNGEAMGDWQVEVQYSFKQGCKYLKALTPKKKISTDSYDAVKQIERQELHLYTFARFKWNAFNGVTFCCWEQDSRKRIGGKWLKIN